MSKLTVGEKLPEFVYDTPFAAGVSMGETAGKVQGKTALVFLRYYGCTLCQYDIHMFAGEYEKITAAGGQLLVALQSDPRKLAEQMAPGDLPFAILCDPEQTLYKRFEIGSAASKEKLLDLKTVGKVARAKASGFRHGDYEGDELQLPAVFVVNRDMELTHVHYGVSGGDVPTPGELAELLR